MRIPEVVNEIVFFLLMAALSGWGGYSLALWIGRTITD